MSWVLHRIDDRLVHGQVVVAWAHRLNPRRMWVVDDATAANAWERELLGSAAPNIEVRVLTVAEAILGYPAEAEAPDSAFLLVRDLHTALELTRAGLKIRVWNVGGLHYAPGKTKVHDYVYLDPADREAARALIALSVALEVQDVPASRAVPLTSLDPELATP